MTPDQQTAIIEAVLVFGGAGLGLLISYLLLSDAIRFACAGPAAIARIFLWGALQLLAITVLVLAWKLGPDVRSGLMRLAISPFIAGMLLDLFILRPRVERHVEGAEDQLGQNEFGETSGGDSR